jgi:hypothetical protein
MKDTVADPRTRTFKVTIMVRNRKVAAGLPADDELLKLPRIRDLTVPELERTDRPGPLFVDADALYQDEQGHYVLKVESEQVLLRGGTASAEVARSISPVLTLRRVRVRLGQRRVRLLGYLFYELADAGGLVRSADRADLVAIVDKPDRFKDGGRALFLRERWQFRPGDLVQVRLTGAGPGRGFYVPVEAVLPEGDRHYVFVAASSGGQQYVARKVPIEIKGQHGELCRIEGEGIKEGTLVILDGAHYLVPDEPVRVLEKESLRR